MLVDRAIIYVRSGKGGDGHVSFRREKFVAKGGPDGGDGGDGGAVVLVASAGVDTLLDLTGRHHWHAGDGQPGRAKQCHGADGQELQVPIPPGTLVYEDQSGQLLGDLDEPGKRLVVARGGRGGFGNEHFKSATEQTPQRATPGEPAEEHTLRLELKLIADVGLVGMPNAGKSTLLAAVSAARPRIGDYPFTTLEPNLGITRLPGDRNAPPRRLVIADIPGLIEGASQGQGLGHEFLRHIERTRLLVHLIDIAPIDGTDPLTNYHTVCQELAQYSTALADKPQVIALSKSDLLADEADRDAAAQRIAQAVDHQPIMVVSAATRTGVDALMEACWQQVKDHKRPDVAWQA